MLPAVFHPNSDVEQLDLSYNRLNGSIPDAWRTSMLVTINLANNMITSPIESLAYIKTLTRVDLSYNWITAETSFADQKEQVGVIFSGLPASIVYADFSVTHIHALHNRHQYTHYHHLHIVHA